MNSKSTCIILGSWFHLAHPSAVFSHRRDIVKKSLQKTGQKQFPFSRKTEIHRDQRIIYVASLVDHTKVKRRKGKPGCNRRTGSEHKRSEAYSLQVGAYKHPDKDLEVHNCSKIILWNEILRGKKRSTRGVSTPEMTPGVLQPEYSYSFHLLPYTQAAPKSRYWFANTAVHFVQTYVIKTERVHRICFVCVVVISFHTRQFTNQQ